MDVRWRLRTASIARCSSSLDLTVSLSTAWSRREQIANVGSRDMTFSIVIRLARRISEIFDADEADGVVVTHGS